MTDHGLDVLIPMIPFIIYWGAYTLYKYRKNRTPVQRLLRGKDKL